MCKINGHSIFTYMFQPIWNTPKLLKSKSKAKAQEDLKNAQAQAEETIKNNSNGDEMAKTASTAKMDSSENKTLSSLRIPLEAQNIGTSLPSNRSLGLNLGG